MKAVVLAAGKGERIRGLVSGVPKPMIAINGQPILQQNIEWLAKFGVTDLYVNLHHLSDVITRHFGDGSRWGVQITYSHEETLLGTAGAVRKIADDVWGDVTEPFLVVYGDNLLAEFDLQAVLDFHQVKRGDGSVCFHWKDDVSQSGIAVVSDDGRILRFIEKPRPDQVVSHWVNAGIYVLEPGILGHIPPSCPWDFAKDVFPALLEQGRALYGIMIDAPLVAVDTPDMLAKAMRR
jgi:NDP-sugar pyrophosphorylase family protein